MTSTFLFYLKWNVFDMDKHEGFKGGGVLILVVIDDYS